MRAVCVVVLQFGQIITEIQLLSVPHAGPLTRTHNCVFRFDHASTQRGETFANDEESANRHPL